MISVEVAVRRKISASVIVKDKVNVAVSLAGRERIIEEVIMKRNIIPTGLIDSNNTVFTTPTNFKPGSTGVYKNGDRQTLGESYTETQPNTVTFVDAPFGDGFSDDKIVMDYEEL